MTIKTRIYPNGFKYIHESVRHPLPITTLFVFIRFGSIHETEERHKGIAHFIEHMCFKGTKSHPTAMDIVSGFDEKGAFLNAETTKQYTCYKVRCLDKYVEPCLRLLSDMLFHSTFKTSDLNLEKHVILEENIRAADDPTSYIDDSLYRVLYAGTPYKDPIDSITYHTPDPLQFKEMSVLYKTFYQPASMGISVISNLSFSTIERHIQSFVKQSAGSPLLPSLEYAPKVYTEPQFNVIYKKGINATHISLAFRTCMYGHKDVYPLSLLKNILGGYMSSRLFVLLREKNGLTYSSTCRTHYHSSSGHLEIYTMCDPTKVMKNRGKGAGVLPLIIGLLRQLIRQGVTQKEVEDAKGNFQGQHLLRMEHNENQCTHNGMEYILYDKTEIDPYESVYENHYASVTKEDIQGVIDRYIRPENMSVCLVGEHAPSLASIQKAVADFQ